MNPGDALSVAGRGTESRSKNTRKGGKVTTQGKRVTGLSSYERDRKGLKSPKESKYSLKVKVRRIKEEVKEDD